MLNIKTKSKFRGFYLITGEQSTDNIDDSEQETANDNENTFDAEHIENDTQVKILLLYHSLLP